jgi:hypothetical protein
MPSPQSKSAKWANRVLVGSFVITVALVIISALVLHFYFDPIRQKEPDRLVYIVPEGQEKISVTLAQFRQLQIGMTYQ